MVSPSTDACERAVVNARIVVSVVGFVFAREAINERLGEVLALACNKRVQFLAE